MDVKALTVVACVLFGTLARAQAPVEPLAAVRAGAERAVRDSLDSNVSGVKLEAATLDARLTLAACGARLDTYVPELRANQSKLLVRVSCAARPGA